MALKRYIEKRNFNETPEPKGGKPDSKKLRFVIQKHAASHLHYDLRLEMEGVLKSWAVPKGPSTNPKIKRLAMMVEDHPYNYRNFEGIIPSGYGAGTVIVWDEGFYHPAEEEVGPTKAEEDKYLRSGIHKGKLHVILEGKKLKGEYALVKTKGLSDNAWLLFKIKDKYASPEDITLKDRSVISKKTLEQMAKAVPEKSKKKQAKKAAPKKITKKPILKKKDLSGKPNISTIKNAPTGPFPKKLSPMLATLVDAPFDKEGWLFEVKWDGYRTLAFSHKGQVELRSRNNKSFNDKFYPIHRAFENWGKDAVLDGEIVVVKEDGVSSFGSLQNWRSEADGELMYYVFDLLWYEGKDLCGLPLEQRKEILKNIIPRHGNIRYSESFGGSGLKFFEAARKTGLEGIIAKKADSLYTAGSRSNDWLKIKANQRQEMVIGGYTVNEGSSKSFSALLVGVFEGDRLIYTGKVGTGFNTTQQKELLAKFKTLTIKKPAFTETPDVNKPSRFRPDPPHATATWLKPKLVCEVSFAEMTSDGVMRHPSFEGLRIDKNAGDVKREQAKTTRSAMKAASKPTKKSIAVKKLVKAPATASRKSLLNPTEETQVRKVNGHELRFTNLSKLYWPKEKISKRDLINYYYQMAPYILPYLKDRPQSMNRHPDGINEQSFYFKDVTGKAPEWVETYLYRSEADGRDRNYLVAKDEASLLYMASLGCIEMNPWSSRVQKEDKPDWCIIDLDPAKNSFDQVIEAAQVTHEILENLGVPSYPKTSGSTGIHVYIPLGAKYSYDQSKEFARIIARLVTEQLPDFTSIERVVKARRGKMYIDFLQNRPQATIAAPYSARPKPGATVSMPLHWNEVKKGLKMSDFTIHNAPERLKKEGDIFKPVLGKGIDLKKVIRQFEMRYEKEE